MAISKKISTMLNEQINAEFESSYIYLAMSAYFESNNLKGFAKWMKVQAEEEKNHAMKFFDHLVARMEKVELSQIKAPQKEWKSPLDVFQTALGHEQYVTARINKIMDLAISEKDHATASFLKWFVDEQIEEESNADEIVQKLKLAKDNIGALMILDKELGDRK